MNAGAGRWGFRYGQTMVSGPSPSDEEQTAGLLGSVRIASCGEIEIAYETFGIDDDPTLVLISGISGQLVSWDVDFCLELAGRGFRVVRFDNRDVGLSTHLHEARVPDLAPLFRRQPILGVPYLLADMAQDVVNLLDALEVERAHIVGMSMGGMIGQELAARYPDRTLTLTSIMSTTAPQIGAPTEEALAALLAPPPTTEEEACARALAGFRVAGSPGYPLDEARLRAATSVAFRRSNDPAGVARQFAAIQASGDRTEHLRGITAPTLVLHGEDDPLMRLDGGKATAAAINGARLVTFPGMGHDLPRQLWPRIIDEITALAAAAG